MSHIKKAGTLLLQVFFKLENKCIHFSTMKNVISSSKDAEASATLQAKYRVFLKTQSLHLNLSFSFLIKSSLSHPAGPWRNWEAADQEVHWRRKEGLREIDRAEGWASVCGEVHFVGVGARGHIHLVQAWRAELEDRNKKKKKNDRWCEVNYENSTVVQSKMQLISQNTLATT